MTASLQGLSTIRAFNAQNILIKEFDSYQDMHSSAWFLFIAANRAFGFWLDVICILFIAGVIFALLSFNKGKLDDLGEITNLTYLLSQICTAATWV